MFECLSRKNKSIKKIFNDAGESFKVVDNEEPWEHDIVIYTMVVICCWNSLRS